jgi:hypothetical protein
MTEKTMGRKTAFGGGSEDETMANLWEYKVKRIIIVSVFKNTTSTRIEVTLPY